jgi:hypothetical protein
MSKNSRVIKIVIASSVLSSLLIVLLFFRPKQITSKISKKPLNKEKLFNQVIQAAIPQIQKLWEDGDRMIKKGGLKCDEEIVFDRKIGRSYYQCQPHFWQCYWQGGVVENPVIKVEVFGDIYHMRATSAFDPLPMYSPQPRFYEIVKGPLPSLNFHFGVKVKFVVDEIPGKSIPIILTDTCRDTYLPQRIYGFGKMNSKQTDDDFIWDNFGRHIFIDRFYVTQQMVNEWYILSGKIEKVESDRTKWPLPAFLDRSDQIRYCAFWGKRLMEAKLFDAASMTPSDLKDPLPANVLRPSTPWQRDLSKTFLGMARINPDYQLTPLDCDLAQVQGCLEKHFFTDSATWMGMNYSLGFYPESLVNNLEPLKNLKLSSRFYDPGSMVHELGELGNWNSGLQDKLPIAFRCYEEVSL